MRIKLTSIMVDDQGKALKFYTEVLGFRKKHDIPVGAHKWLTVVSAEGPDDIELALEPNSNAVAQVFQQAMFAQSIPLAAFEVADIDGEYARLKALNVVFTNPNRLGSFRQLVPPKWPKGPARSPSAACLHTVNTQRNKPLRPRTTLALGLLLES